MNYLKTWAKSTLQMIGTLLVTFLVMVSCHGISGYSYKQLEKYQEYREEKAAEEEAKKLKKLWEKMRPLRKGEIFS